MIDTYKKMTEGDQQSAMVFQMFAPSLPMYMLQFKGKLDVELDPEDVMSLL